MISFVMATPLSLSLSTSCDKTSPPIKLGTSALHITNFYVPPYVPISLPTNGQQQQQQIGIGNNNNIRSHHLSDKHLDLAKPILFDCDYDYKIDEDIKLTVRWFRNKELEPFYQWLPELNERHFADWIKPLVNETFVSDPHDPLKRYRSILIKRLSMNLTGTYSCLVSSLAGQDMKQSSVIIYHPPRSFAFEHKIFPAPAGLVQTATPNYYQQNYYHNQHGPPPPPNNHHLANQQQLIPALDKLQQQQQQRTAKQDPAVRGNLNLTGSPTQFKSFNQSTLIVRPANNNNNLPNSTNSLTWHQQNNANSPNNSTRIVYTHDGRPIRRKSKRQTPSLTPFEPSKINQFDWMLKKRLEQSLSSTSATTGIDKDSALSLPTSTSSHKLDSSSAHYSPSTNNNNNNQQFKLNWSPPPLTTKVTNQQSQLNRYAIQLHHFKCQANQITPRPVIVLTVKRDSDSIAQYLHESSSVSIRPYQVSQADYYYHDRDHSNGQFDLSSFTGPLSSRHHATDSSQTQLKQQQSLPRVGSGDRSALENEMDSNVDGDQESLENSPNNNNNNEKNDKTSSSSHQQPTRRNDTTTDTIPNHSAAQQQLFYPTVTLYNITVSATVALNVSLGPIANHPPLASTSGLTSIDNLPSQQEQEQQQYQAASRVAYIDQQQLQPGINTILPFRRGQRMSFECHLEITGTEYEDIKRININEEEVYQFAESQLQQYQQQRRLKGFDQTTGSSDSSSSRSHFQELSKINFVLILNIVSLFSIIILI